MKIIWDREELVLLNAYSLSSTQQVIMSQTTNDRIIISYMTYDRYNHQMNNGIKKQPTIYFRGIHYFLRLSSGLFTFLYQNWANLLINV